VSLLHSTTQPDPKASMSASSLDEVSLRLLLATTVPTADCLLKCRPTEGNVQLISAGLVHERLA
jgi:hypothetical protein